MTTQSNKILYFKENVDSIFSDITEWAKAKNLNVLNQEIQLTEEDETYSTQQLIIQDNNKEIAKLTPIAAHIIGGDGRIDFKGVYNDFVLLLLSKEGPKIKVSTSSEDIQETPLFKNISEDGWYYIKREIRTKGYKLSQEVFFDLLDVASDYDYDNE